MVVGPDWNGDTPARIKQVFRSSTQFSMGLFRTQLFSPDDMPNVIAVQAGYKVRPLSAWLGRPAPPQAPAVHFPPINAELMNENFFDYLNFVLEFAPPGPEELQIRAELARIGVGPTSTFNYDNLPAAEKAQVQLGAQDGLASIERYLTGGGLTYLNGWGIVALFGDRSFYDGDWLMRAAGARAGIFGNDATEAMYPSTKTLANGEVLDSSRYKYTITFPADQLPPVNAFWSVTMYDANTQLLVSNPINRYLINSPMLGQLNVNGDGSLTLYLQKDSPGPALESNWLPAPNGPMYVVMRLYWPTLTPPSILPPGAGTWLPPVIEKTGNN